MEVNKIYCGDCLEIMEQFSSESIDMCMTSPPYWGLRDYGVDGQYGLEPTPELYIEHMTAVFHEVKRVLKKEGTLWLNIGDTYSGSCCGSNDYRERTGLGVKPTERYKGQKAGQTSLPAKCMVMIPERLAWSLIQDGWILRNKIVWYKPNAMPSSVKDRFSNKWEYLYLFSQQQKYYFDLDAVREQPKWDIVWSRKGSGDGTPYEQNNPRSRWGITRKESKEIKHDIAVKREGNYSYTDPLHTMPQHPLGKNPGDVFQIPSETRTLGAILGTGKAVKVPGGKGWTGHPEGGGAACQKDPRWCPPEGKNPGDFWSIPTQPFPEAHFAVFPEKLCEKPIKAGCPEGGVVLDPFCGAGTTCYVAKEMGRQYIGIDISPEYTKMNDIRLAQGVL